MFRVSGPLHPESPLFVGREVELGQIGRWLERGDCVGAVSGPRQTGKTSLLLQARHRMQAKHRFVYIDLEGIFDACKESCYAFLCGEMIEQLAEYLETPEALSPASDSASFLAFLRQLSRQISAVRVAVILDEIGALPRETSVALAHTIRATLTSRHVRTEYSRYVFALSGSSDMRRLTTDKVSPLRNVIDCIYLADLSEEQADTLLVRGFAGRSLDVPRDVRFRIYHWTAGHPYFTQLLGMQVADGLSESHSPPTVARVDELVDALLGLEGKNLPHTRRMLDMSPRSGQLWACLKRVLDDGTVRFSRSDEDVAELELIGTIRDQDAVCAIRSRIYERALQEWIEARDGKGGGERAIGRRVSRRWRALVGRLSPAQTLMLLVIVFTLAVDIMVGWIRPPEWLTDRAWLFWVVLGVAVIAFVAVSIVQVRTPDTRDESPGDGRSHESHMGKTR